MFKRWMLFAMSILFVAIGALSAQNPPTSAQLAQLEVQRYSIVLNLTTSQQQQALTIFTTEQTTLEPVKKAEHLAQEMLVTAIKTSDTSTITQVSSVLGELKAQTILAESVAKEQLYATLTTDQQTKFATMLSSDSAGGGAQGMFGVQAGPPPRR